MKLQEIFGERVKREEPLKDHTTYKIGGPAEWYLEVNSAVEAERAIKAAKEDGLLIFILGGGSNILVADAGVRGLTLVYAARSTKIDGTELTAEAGVATTLVAKNSAAAGLAGFEWAAGVPGTLGGAVRGNAGGYGSTTGNVIEAVEAVNLETGEKRSFSRDECGFGYRDSRFKNEPWLILSAVLSLTAGDRAALEQKIAEIMAARRKSLPLEFGSAGCVFKNHLFNDASELSPKLAAIVKPEFLDWKKIPAAWLIDRVEIRGKKIGDAMVSEKHANFIVNTGEAKADEVIQLISYVKMKVRDEFGVQLVEEIQYVGF